MSSHSVLALASGKGGVGKTTSAVNLGAALAGAGHSVAIVDADLGMANLASVLDLDPSGPTLHDVLANDATLREATYGVGSISVVPGGDSLAKFGEADPARLRGAIDRLREAFEYVIIDVGAGLSHDTVLPLGIADAVLVVTTPERPSLQNARTVVEVTERLDGAVDGVLVTRVSGDVEVDLDVVEARVGAPVLAILPEDPAVRRSAAEGVPVTVSEPDAPAARAYTALAGVVDGRTPEAIPIVPSVEELGTSDSPGTESDATVEGGDSTVGTDRSDATSRPSEDAASEGPATRLGEVYVSDRTPVDDGPTPVAPEADETNEGSEPDGVGEHAESEPSSDERVVIGDDTPSVTDDTEAVETDAEAEPDEGTVEGEESTGDRDKPDEEAPTESEGSADDEEPPKRKGFLRRLFG